MNISSSNSILRTFREANILRLRGQKTGSYFPDAASVSSFAKEGVIWAIDSGIITGDGGKINPQGTANRAQCATIISRFLGME